MKLNREDLKKYKDNQEWIKDQIEYIEEQKDMVNKLTATITDMPVRKQRSSRQYGRKIS